MAGRAWVVVCVAVVAAGCFAGPTPFDEPLQDLERSLPKLIDDNGGVEMTLPIDVYTIGFSEEAVKRINGSLQDLVVWHASLSFAREFPPDPGDAADSFAPNPFKTKADYRLHRVPEALAAQFFESIGMTLAEGRVLDANAAEDWLLEHLPQVRPLDKNRSSLVLVHAGDHWPEDHAFRYTYPNGWLEPVRVFGERHPFLVIDVSAAVDGFAGDRLPYQRPIENPETRTKAITELIHNATRFRLLQGPIYPPALTDCHAVTLLVLVRGTAVAERLPGFTPGAQFIDAEGLKRAWENVTGEGTVFVDVVTKDLPADDPVLDTLFRTGSLDAIRWWLDENWDQYWVPHEGCEPYVSIFLFGDAADSGVSGIATYDVRRSHRISFSHVNDGDRITEDYSGVGSDLFEDRPPSRFSFNWFNLLVAHETGHLLGQRHPHDITLHDGGGARQWTFSSVWSSMSYQSDDRIADFGKIDYANFQRNRVGFLVQEAQSKSLTGSPEFQQAWELVGAYRWEEAASILIPLVASAGA